MLGNTREFHRNGYVCVYSLYYYIQDDMSYLSKMSTYMFGCHFLEWIGATSLENNIPMNMLKLLTNSSFLDVVILIIYAYISTHMKLFGVT